MSNETFVTTVQTDVRSKSPAQPFSIFGTATTHKLGKGSVRYIEGITTLEPTSAGKKQHKQLFQQLGRENQQKFLESQQIAKQRVLTLGNLVGGAARFVLPDHVFKFWLTPSNTKTIARAHYAEDGRAYPSIDLDDVVESDLRTLIHYLSHEFVHLFSLHQTYQSVGKTAAGLLYEVTIFQVGLCFRQTSNFTVQNIQKKHWDEWASNILTIDKAFKEGNRQVKLEGISPTALQMIHIFKEKFGSDWLEQAKATLRTRGEELYKIGEWTAKVELVTGEDLNETLTEFLARILSCQNMLAPTSEEIGWFKSTRIYGNLDGINQLMAVFCAIENQGDKIAYLSCLIKTLQSANLNYLIEEMAKYDSSATAGNALSGKVAPKHETRSSGGDLLELLQDLLHKIL
jgi:hypothetical protein